MRFNRFAAALIAAIAAFATLTTAATLPAQQKPPITPADYGQWERLDAGVLSPDGTRLAVGIRRVDGTSELQVHTIGAAEEPLRIENGNAIVLEPGRTVDEHPPAFSSDAAWLAYQVGYSEEEQERMREQEQPLRNKLGLVDLRGGGTETIDAVESFSFDDTGAYLAIRGYPEEGQESADLVIRDLAAGTSINFGNVAAFAWQDDGALLAMTIDTEHGTGNGVQLYAAAGGSLRVLDSGDATFSGLAWRDESDDLAVLRAAGNENHDDPTHIVLAWRDLASAAGVPTALRFDHREASDFPAGMRVVEHRAPSWSADGSAVFFGIREWPERPAAAGDEEGTEDEPEAAAEAESSAEAAKETAERSGEEEKSPAGRDATEPADVDVWHALDERINPMQKLQESRDRQKSYLSVWHVDTGRFVRLGSDLDETVTLLHGQQHATETDRKEYIFDRMFGRRWFDVDLIDVASGERRRVIDRVRYFYGGSANGEYLLYFKDDQHYSYDIAGAKHTDLTAGLPTSFVNEQFDFPVEQRPSHGLAGWAKDDAAVLLYDRYDIWSVAPDGSGAAKLTDGAAEDIRHRYTRIDPEERFIDPARPLYLSLYGQWTKQSGYARLDPPRSANQGAGDSTGARPPSGPLTGNAPGGFSTDMPTRLVWLDKNVGRLIKAVDTDTYAYLVQDFNESPNYFAGDAQLTDAEQITNTNPFQDDFAWGHSELLDYSCDFGPRLQAALKYPASYEPGNTYPMITYVYELRSQTLHSYSVPSERSPYNAAVWTSLGYFVLAPDITYRGRRPGTSAVECVRPAVQAAVDTGMVDAERVGLIGHSWGGYEAAFIPTKTDVFAASVSGAALTNFFSMFGAIHWNQGLPESSHFETGQARMDVPYWDDMEAYVRESPVIGIPDLETPMLMAFGDEDGTVDWHQGVEMYNYARRAGKQFVMLVYADENHSNRQKKNQVDYHYRVLDWFDHYLKGEEAEPWITRGTSVIERNDELKRLKR